jgi:hypothetical protein
MRASDDLARIEKAKRIAVRIFNERDLWKSSIAHPRLMVN